MDYVSNIFILSTNYIKCIHKVKVHECMMSEYSNGFIIWTMRV